MIEKIFQDSKKVKRTRNNVPKSISIPQYIPQSIFLFLDIVKFANF